MILLALFLLTKPVVAVLYFDVHAESDAYKFLSGAICDMLITDLVLSDKFTVVEREELDKVLSEIKLGIEGLTKMENVIKVGELLNAKYIITGSVTVIGDNYRLDVRMIEVETGEIIFAEKAQCSSKDRLFDAVDMIADKICGSEIAPARGPRMDVLFIIDATGSMADEIEKVKSKITEIIREIERGRPTPRLRFGLVAYRDRGDVFVVKKYKFTFDKREFEQALYSLTATGGGDYREDVNEALRVAIEEMNWDTSKDVARIAFLIGDAPPHMDYNQKYTYKNAIKRAREKGITISTIICSGMNQEGVNIFKEIATGTNGTAEYLTYYHEVVTAEGKKIKFAEKGEKYFLEMFSIDKKGKPVGKEKIMKIKAKAVSERKTSDIDKVLISGIKRVAISKGVKYTEEKFKEFIIKSDGETFCIKVSDEKTIKELEKAKRGGKEIWLMVNIKARGKNEFEITPGNVYYIKKPPQSVRVDIKKIKENPEYYEKYGLGEPNLWAIKVKVIK